MSFEEVQEFLTKTADSMPAAIYNKLNGGIILVPETKLHPESRGDTLYILGQYHYEPRGFGRYITIYYGSFCQVCANRTRRMQEQKLREVLQHELVHHLEHQAGDKSLEIKDAVDIARYKRRRPGEDKE